MSLERIYAALDAAGWDRADQPTGEQIETILDAAEAGAEVTFTWRKPGVDVGEPGRFKVPLSDVYDMADLQFLTAAEAIGWRGEALAEAEECVGGEAEAARIRSWVLCRETCRQEGA